MKTGYYDYSKWKTAAAPYLVQIRYQGGQVFQYYFFRRVAASRYVKRVIQQQNPLKIRVSQFGKIIFEHHKKR